MPHAVKITEAMLPGIFDQAANGKSLAQIRAWIHLTHGVEVSASAIRKKLTRRREERAEVAKVLVRETLAKTVVSDIDVLDREKRRLRRLATRLYRQVVAPLPEGHGVPEALQIQAARSDVCDTYLKAIDRLTKVVDTKLHYAGADAPDDGNAELAAAEERLTRKLARLQSGGDEGVSREPEPGGEGSP